MHSLLFTPEEYKERLLKTREEMYQQGVDALIVTKPENMFYLSGFRAVVANFLAPLMAIIIPKKGEPRLITRSLEVRVAHKQWTKRPVLYTDHVNPFKILAEILEESRADRGIIGIEETDLTVWRLNKIKQALRNARFKDVSGTITRLTANPSKTEIEYIRRAGKIADIGFQRAIESVKEGIYCYEIIAEIHNCMYKAGQSDTNVGRVWCWAGPEGGQLHDSSLNRRIRKNDLVTIELQGVYGMYRVGAQGTLYVGNKPAERILKIYKMVSDMYRAARTTVKAGVEAGEIYGEANKIYHDITGEDYFRRVGGSMGLGSFVISLNKGNKETLNPGVPIMIQSLVNEPVFITCSGTILVTESGGEQLTNPLLELKTV